MPEQHVSVGGKAQLPASNENPGFVLGGWYMDAYYAEAWGFETDKASEDITLYAKWTKELALMPSDADGKIYVGEEITITPGNTFKAVKSGETAVSYSAEGQTAVFVVNVTEASPAPAATAAFTTTATNQGFLWIILIAVLGAALLAGVIFAVMRKYKRRSAERPEQN